MHGRPGSAGDAHAGEAPAAEDQRIGEHGVDHVPGEVADHEGEVVVSPGVKAGDGGREDRGDAAVAEDGEVLHLISADGGIMAGQVEEPAGAQRGGRDHGPGGEGHVDPLPDDRANALRPVRPDVLGDKRVRIAGQADEDAAKHPVAHTGRSEGGDGVLGVAGQQQPIHDLHEHDAHVRKDQRAREQENPAERAERAFVEGPGGGLEAYSRLMSVVLDRLLRSEHSSG